MPILIRAVLQGTFVFVSALLSFAGVTPDISVPTEEEARQATEERKEIIRDLLEDPYARPQATDPRDITIDDRKLPQTPIPRETPVPSLPHLPALTPVVDETPKPVDLPEPEPTVEKTSTDSSVVVNILCTNREANRINVSTGSGVLISESGVILTNAHVAQLFLLKNYSRANYMDCSIRRENIPTVGYTADLLYISTDWIKDNAHLIQNPAPRGTGENDYALLAITGSTNAALALPSSFPYAQLETKDGSVEIGDTVTVAGYPGVQINPFDLNGAARLSSDHPRITDVYTFARTTVDIFSTSETPVAERGSSGGGVFKGNELVGIIVSTNGGTSHNTINAISVSYINSDIREEAGTPLSSFLSGNTKNKAAAFMKDTGESLTKTLEKYLD